MMSEDDVAFVIVARYNMFDTRPRMPGSTAIRANCGHQSWISPSGRAFLNGDGIGAYVICDTCTDPEELQADPDVKTSAIPGADDEFRDVLGTELGNDFMKMLKRKGFDLW